MGQRILMLGTPEIILLSFRIWIIQKTKYVPSQPKYVFYVETLATSLCMAEIVGIGSSKDSVMFTWMLLTLFDFILFYRDVWYNIGACLIQYLVLLTIQLCLNGAPEKEELPLFILKNFVALGWYLGALIMIHITVIRLANHASGFVDEIS